MNGVNSINKGLAKQEYAKHRGRAFRLIGVHKFIGMDRICREEPLFPTQYEIYLQKDCQPYMLALGNGYKNYGSNESYSTLGTYTMPTEISPDEIKPIHYVPKDPSRVFVTKFGKEGSSDQENRLEVSDCETGEILFVCTPKSDSYPTLDWAGFASGKVQERFNRTPVYTGSKKIYLIEGATPEDKNLFPEALDIEKPRKELTLKDLEGRSSIFCYPESYHSIVDSLPSDLYYFERIKLR